MRKYFFPLIMLIIFETWLISLDQESQECEKNRAVSCRNIYACISWAYIK